MRTPTERAAQTMLGVRWPDGSIEGMPGRKVIDMLAQGLADAGVLAAPEHDEQVRADERARVSVVHSTLTDEQLVAELVRRGVLEEKREDRLRPTRVPCDCEHPTHRRLVGDDSPPTHAAYETVPVVQYATPWKPDTRTDEQRTDDAITTLRRRLTEEPTDG